ncbi:MAG: MFS transporter, partial [Candidatus Methanomethylophilaceae archaeon]|nr:MFS transporter [Candidatus Methanomethylophilaceae archaeon]
MIFLITCLDGTVVTICGKQIMEDIGGLEYYSWLNAGYVLSQTALIPIAGKISDQFGRKPVLYAGTAVFVISSLTAALSFSPLMMISSRIMQGIGGGMIVPVSNALIADMYGPSERSKVMASVNLLCTVGMAAGPFIGGIISAVATWHWVFLINIPLAVLFFVLTAGKFPSQSIAGNRPKVDYSGMAALTTVILVSILVFQFSDSFGHYVIAAAAVFILMMLILFFRIEKSAEEPVISIKMLKRKEVKLSSVFLFFNNFGMMGLITYIVLFAMYVLHLTEMECALLCIPLFISMAFLTIVNG